MLQYIGMGKCSGKFEVAEVQELGFSMSTLTSKYFLVRLVLVV